MSYRHSVSRSPLPETCPRFEPPAVWVSYGYAVYLGPSLALAPHSTAVDCLAIGVDASFSLRRPGSENRTARSVLVPARSLHQIISDDGSMMFAYLDPSSAGARKCRQRMARADGGFGFDHEAESELIRLCRDESPDPVRLLERAAGSAVHAIDPRIAAAIEAIRAQSGRSDSAAQIASSIGLSRSYFLRLFAAQTGTTLRRYRLWARMIRAMQRVSQGCDLTRASMEAGFASPSHFSDTFNKIFGLTATALLKSGITIILADDVLLSQHRNFTLSAGPRADGQSDLDAGGGSFRRRGEFDPVG
jgi:AraC-like DNA-binding protein